VADVRKQLIEALDQAERLARAAMGHQVFDGTGIVTMSPTLTGLHRSVVIEGNVATFLRRWDPSTVLRLIERERRLTERHRPDQDDSPIVRCFTDDDLWPCDEINLAAAFWLGTPEVDR
jgi:hypothetical protein